MLKKNFCDFSMHAATGC